MKENHANNQIDETKEYTTKKPGPKQPKQKPSPKENYKSNEIQPNNQIQQTNQTNTIKHWSKTNRS